MKNIIIILICLLLILCLVNLLKTKCESNVNEYYDGKIRKLKAANPGYGKIVSVDDNGNLNSFEFPRGIIVAWSGELNKIPDGWALCDGKTTGVPDLRGRFILGANPNTNKNSNFSINEMSSLGGEEKHTLTIDEMPAHNHNFCFGGGWRDQTEGSGRGPEDGSGSNSNCRYQRINVSNTGGNKPHNVMPPYYALAYIMKL
jgi:microcystin-dependent protein